MEKCQNCGRSYRTVYRIPDELWRAITGRSDGLLCPRCLDDKARTAGYGLYWEATVGKFPTDKLASGATGMTE